MMPHYLDNNVLPTPTQTLSNILFSTFWLFPSFLLKINAFPMLYESLAKGRLELGSIASKSMRPTTNTTETDTELASFFVLTNQITR